MRPNFTSHPVSKQNSNFSDPVCDGGWREGEINDDRKRGKPEAESARKATSGSGGKREPDEASVARPRLGVLLFLRSDWLSVVHGPHCRQEELEAVMGAAGVVEFLKASSTQDAHRQIRTQTL